MSLGPMRHRQPVFLWAVGLVALFASTRLVLFVTWQLPEANFVANDVYYYGYHLWRLLEQGEPGVMLEYPVPAVWILQALYTVGGGWQAWFPWFATSMLVIDALVAMSLYRRSNPTASAWWILFTGACGALVWFRFDLIPAALVAWACLWLSTRPRLAGALVAVGAAVKLWPALLALPLAAPNPRAGAGRQRLVGFLVVGFLMGMASLLTHGWTRSASPLVWQADRGLQIESVPAAPLMFLRTFTDGGHWAVFLSDYNAIELRGPGVGAMLHVSTALTAAVVVLAAGMALRMLRNLSVDDPRSGEAILMAVLVIVLGLIVANKTLSPQYITWLGGPVAALILARRSPELPRRPLRTIAAAVLLVAALTQYTYPWGTYGIMAMPNGAGWETSVLLLRNALLVALTAFSAGLFWRITRPRAIG